MEKGDAPRDAALEAAQLAEVPVSVAVKPHDKEAIAWQAGAAMVVNPQA